MFLRKNVEKDAWLLPRDGATVRDLRRYVKSTILDIKAYKMQWRSQECATGGA